MDNPARLRPGFIAALCWPKRSIQNMNWLVQVKSVRLCKNYALLSIVVLEKKLFFTVEGDILRNRKSAVIHLSSQSFLFVMSYYKDQVLFRITAVLCMWSLDVAKLVC